jgi:hypothetical protein
VDVPWLAGCMNSPCDNDNIRLSRHLGRNWIARVVTKRANLCQAHVSRVVRVGKVVRRSRWCDR